MVRPAWVSMCRLRPGRPSSSPSKLHMPGSGSAVWAHAGAAQAAMTPPSSRADADGRRDGDGV